jgi:hypothetical protein
MESASAAGIVVATQRLAPNLASRRWIASNNRYRERVIKTLRDDTKLGRVNAKDLADYIAASAPLHCADGWSYLGRAVRSHARGDRDTASHLAYYAELRAALGLLASQGIGVFDHDHAAVDGKGEATAMRFWDGTHVIVWEALSRWSRSPAAATALGAALRPRGTAIDAWVASLPLGSTGTWAPIGKQWLEAWGLDLSKFSQDRNARNDASYRPTRLATQPALTAEQTLDFLRDVWVGLEPSEDAPFFALDRHLLRRGLEMAYTRDAQRIPRSDDANWEKAVTETTRAVIGADGDAILESFLLRRGSPESRLIELSRTPSDIRDPNHHLGVISRATLMLRLASGVVADQLAAAGVSTESLSFWAEEVGEERGLWGHGEMPEPLVDLYGDIIAALEDVDGLQSEGVSPHYKLREANWAAAISPLDSCERVALWSLA